MEITFKSFQGIGKREIQEDSYSMSHGISSWAVVCDGVGGSRKGEVASATVVKVLEENIVGMKAITRDRLEVLIKGIPLKLAEIEKLEPNSKGMGTTLALCCTNKDQLIAAHIGDSPIFHIREGQVLWRSKDHSLVNQLLDLEMITPEEAIDHPQKNVITKALKAKEDSTYVMADFQILTDLQAGDFIFVCSDGVMEAVDEQQLSEIFTNFSLDEIVDLLDKRCTNLSKDNFTGVVGLITKSSI